jgi:hypothetical protein
MPTTLSPCDSPVMKRVLFIIPGWPGLKFNSLLLSVTANMVAS